MKLPLALAQINTQLGNVEANLAKHLELASEARKNGAEVLLFPELSLTGYVLQDLAATVARTPRKQEPVFKSLLKASQEIDLLVGFVEQDSRYRFYIAAAYLSRGEITHIHRKVHLPTYGIFDEKRYFAAGDTFRSFDTRFGKAGILICEDFWHVSSPYLLWQDGADLFYLTSASPGRGVTEDTLGTARWDGMMNQTYAGLFTSFFAHANRAGFEDGLNFWGGSSVHDPDGQRIAQGDLYEEGLVYAELDLNQIKRTRSRLPLLRDENPELTLRELKRITKK